MSQKAGRLLAKPTPHARIWGTLDPFVEGGAILGRKVANSAFLEALLRADPYDAYHFFLFTEGAGDALRGWLQERFPSLLARGAVYVGGYLSLQEHLTRVRYHAMHLSDILTHYTRLAQLRNVFAPVLFPVTGLTHSLSYAQFMEGYCRHLWPGVCPRDAVIVTSRSAGLVMERVFAGLRQGYGLGEKEFPAPKAVCLPLGITPEELPGKCDRWEAGGAKNPGLAMRARLGIAADPSLPLLLYFGRICPQSKMDLLPVFAALRRAEALGLPKDGFALVLAGWVEEGDALPEALRSYAASLGIRVIVFPRPTKEERFALYAAADVFLSPSDNIQETFGLTVAEAGAAGLPVIASDFDGYRDIVVPEKTGLLIPTLGFAQSIETEVQALCWFDNQYHLKLAQETVVDVPELALALARLGSDAALRRRMGEEGRRHVLKHFAWDGVIARYAELWDNLAAIPLAEEEEARLRRAAHPQRMRFAHYFQGHFTRVLNDECLAGMVLRRTKAGEALYRGALPVSLYAGMEHMLDAQAVRRLLLAARVDIPARDALAKLAEHFAKDAPPHVAVLASERAGFTLLWCLKQDYLECRPAGAGAL